MLQFYAARAFNPQSRAIQPAKTQETKPDCLFAGRHNVRVQKPNLTVYHGVRIFCDDKEKRKVIRQAIDLVRAAGFDLSGVTMAASRKHDLALSPNVFGACTAEEKRIVFRYGVNWPEQAAKTTLAYPVWAQNTYAGGPIHLVLHEIGHYLHHQNNEAAYSVAFRPFSSDAQNRITADLGHPYPATCAAEMIPEMIAGKIGAQKQFSAYCETLYRNHGGPAIPAEPQGARTPHTVSWTV